MIIQIITFIELVFTNPCFESGITSHGKMMEPIDVKQKCFILTSTQTVMMEDIVSNGIHHVEDPSLYNRSMPTLTYSDVPFEKTQIFYMTILVMLFTVGGIDTEIPIIITDTIEMMGDYRKFVLGRN